MTEPLNSLSVACTSVVNDILTLAIVHHRFSEAAAIVDTFIDDEMAGALFYAGVSFAVIEPLNGIPLRMNEVSDEGSPHTAAARMVIMASNRDHEMLHAQAVVATRQPREWRDLLLLHLVQAVNHARAIRQVLR